MLFINKSLVECIEQFLIVKFDNEEIMYSVPEQAKGIANMIANWRFVDIGKKVNVYRENNFQPVLTLFTIDEAKKSI